MKLRNLSLPILSLIALFGVGAYASTVQVGSCALGYPQYPTISAAVAAVPANTIIDVCPGQYAEQVTITQNLTIRGKSVGGEDAAVIVAPSGGVVQNATDVDTGEAIAAQIAVLGPGITVTLGDLTVDGTNNGITGCAPDLQGILYQTASGTISNVTVRNQYLGSGLGGCQSGEGIYVQTASGGASVVTVTDASVHGYQKNGITGNDTGTTLTVKSSRVQGFGVVQYPNAAQNGIQLAFGAQGTVETNFVADNVYADTAVAIATGILLYDTANGAGIQVNSNIVANSQGAVVLYTGQDDGAANLGNGVTANSNNIFATVNYDAIDVCTNGNTINDNKIYDSSQSGIHMDGSCSSYGSEATGNNNGATGNTITESGCAGVLVDSGTTGDSIGTNTYYDDPSTVLNGACSDSRAQHATGTHHKLYSPKGRK
ncbi:MAG TPA: right-handed parallel beta-helix repeat-containing protein [Terriglobales bacterium]